MAKATWYFTSARWSRLRRSNSGAVIELALTREEGPTADRTLLLDLPRDEAVFVVETIARWLGTWDEGRTGPSYSASDRGKRAAAALREIADKMEAKLTGPDA